MFGLSGATVAADALAIGGIGWAISQASRPKSGEGSTCDPCNALGGTGSPPPPDLCQINPEHPLCSQSGRTSTKRFENLYDDKAIPIARRELVLRGEQWKTVGNGGAWTPKGNYDFVVVNGRVFVGREGCGHINLARGRAVDYAGSLRFNSRGQLTSWNNNSGHYQPSAQFAPQAGLPMDKFISVAP